MKKEITLYTIGHGNRDAAEMLRLLNQMEIKFLIDVRSSPYSKWADAFNKDQIEPAARSAGITYTYMGKELGGLPEDRNCYVEGQVDYSRLAQRPAFIEGLDRLQKADEKGVKAVVMCSELKPELCHRSKLIARELEKRGLRMMHIDENDELKTQVEVMNIVTKGKGDVDLFGEVNLGSRKKYE